MTATLRDPLTVPSLAELREAARRTCLYGLQRHELNALLDIAEAAVEVHRISLRATEPWDRLGAALAKVRP